MRRGILFFLLIVVLGVVPVLSQDACPPIVVSVLDNLENICNATERNEACYGNDSLNAEPQQNVSDFKFDTVQDIESVGDIRAIRMAALDVENDQWGVAMMRLQANLPDTLPGENVTFLLFGDVELINAVPPDSTDLRPMQAFYLRTGIGEAACAEAPADGLMVRTPEGRGELAFSVNGVDVAIGSDVFLQASPPSGDVPGFLTGQTFNGSVYAGTPFGNTGGVAGTQFTVPLGNDLLPSGPPEDVTPYGEQNMSLPPNLFGEVPPPLQPIQAAIINNLIQAGTAPCGNQPFLPSCEDVISALGGDKCPINDAGEMDCSIALPPGWQEINPPAYEDVSVWDETPGSGDGGGESTNAEPTSLPPGCEPGICLQEPAQACKCVLCGVACPVDTAPPVESTVDCTLPENAGLPACQQSTGGGGTDGGGSTNTGGDTGGSVPDDGGSTTPPVTTEAPVNTGPQGQGDCPAGTIYVPPLPGSTDGSCQSLGG